MVQVSLTLLLDTFSNFCAKLAKLLNFISVSARFGHEKIFTLK
jgi:hypothetical protein